MSKAITNTTTAPSAARPAQPDQRSQTSQMQRPAWLTECNQSFSAAEAHVFLLHGDIAGYAAPDRTQRDFLVQWMAEQRRIVARYDRASGITFPYDQLTGKDLHRREARRLVERARQAQLLAAQTGGASSASAEGNAGGSALRAVLGQLAGSASASQGQQDDPFADTQRPTAAFPVLEQLLRATAISEAQTGGERALRDPRAPGVGGVVVIVDYAETLLPATEKYMMPGDERTLLVQLLTWAKDDSLGACGNPVFLLATRLAEVHSDLRAASSGIKVVEIALPDRAARLAYLRWYLDDRAAHDEPLTLDGVTVEELANLTAGLSLRHVENILLLGANAGAVTYALVKGAKDAIIASEYTEVAEMVEPLSGGFGALGGVDQLAAWARADVIEPLRGGHTLDAPKGVLLVGPPGSGKTMIVRALAAELGFNAVALRSENILGGIVGESERKLKQFFAFARALAPVVVFFDEIDQSDMSRRGNGSGNPVASNLFNQMLQFMSDETLRGKVVVIFATNRPDLLDPALLRFGRMDAVIPVLLPDAEARASILCAQARSQRATLSAEIAAQIAAQTEAYSPADLAAVVAKARKLHLRRSRQRNYLPAGVEVVEVSDEAPGQTPTLTAGDLEEALRMIRPQTPNIAEYYTKLAIEACNDTEFLPQQYAQLLDDRAALREEIEATEPPAIRNRRERRGGF